MTDTAITGLTALAANPANGDLFEIVDVSDTTMAATGTNKYLAASYISFRTNTETLTNKTLTAPAIADFTSATHTHQNAAGGGQLDHGLALTGLSDDDHTQYLLATGDRAGASSQAQTFTNGVITGKVYPSSDSTTAVQVTKADGSTAVVTVDTTNKRVGFGVTPSFFLDGLVDSNATERVHYKQNNAGSSAQLLFELENDGVKKMQFGITSGAFTSTPNIAFLQGNGIPLVLRSTFATGYISFGGGSSGTERARMDANGLWGLGTASPAARLHLAGNLSASAWGTAGIHLQAAAATFTDSSTASSGTATNAVANSFGQPTFAASNTTVTMTNAATVYIAAAPTAGTNVTLTNAYALWVDDGTARFDGLVTTPASTTSTAGLRIPHGSAPTSPVDGDVWTTTAGLYVRINGATVGPLS